eukprot:563085_1
MASSCSTPSRRYNACRVASNSGHQTRRYNAFRVRCDGASYNACRVASNAPIYGGYIEMKVRCGVFHITHANSQSGVKHADILVEYRGKDALWCASNNGRKVASNTRRTRRYFDEISRRRRAVLCF